MKPGLEDQLVFAHRAVPAVLGHVGHVAGAGDAPGESMVGGDQNRVARRLEDRLVDRLVEAEVVRQLVGTVLAYHLVVEGRDRVDLGIGDARAGDLTRQRLEAGHDREDLFEVLQRQARHRRAAVGRQLHVTLGGKNP